VNGRTFDGLIRTTAVVDADGVISSVEYNVNPEGHVARLRDELLK
jgi:peroxiredoxin Q/BCP